MVIDTDPKLLTTQLASMTVTLGSRSQNSNVKVFGLNFFELISSKPCDGFTIYVVSGSKFLIRARDSSSIALAYGCGRVR